MKINIVDRNKGGNKKKKKVSFLNQMGGKRVLEENEFLHEKDLILIKKLIFILLFFINKSYNNYKFCYKK